MRVLDIIWQLSLFASVLGFVPTLFLIHTVWKHYSSEQDVIRTPSKMVKEWFPVVVYSWFASVGIFLATFLYLIYFVYK